MKKKSNVGIIILVIIDIALLIVILISAVRENELKKFDNQNLVSESDNTSIEKNDDVSVPETVDYNQEEVEESQEGNADNFADSLNTQGVEGIVDIEDEQGNSEFNISDYSTTDRPSLSDFMWYFDGVYAYGIPEESVPIYEASQIVGDWKGFIFYDPDRKFNSYALEFMNVNLDIQGQKADVVLDLYQYCPEGSEIIDVSGEKMSYSGNYEAGAVYATGGGNVHIDSFYTMPDKKQYAVGYIDTVDGTPAYIALVRP